MSHTCISSFCRGLATTTTATTTSFICYLMFLLSCWIFGETLNDFHTGQMSFLSSNQYLKYDSECHFGAKWNSQLVNYRYCKINCVKSYQIIVILHLCYFKLLHFMQAVVYVLSFYSSSESADLIFSSVAPNATTLFATLFQRYLPRCFTLIFSCCWLYCLEVSNWQSITSVCWCLWRLFVIWSITESLKLSVTCIVFL